MFMAPRWSPNQPWKRMGRTMDKALMDEPAMGTHPPSFEEDQPAEEDLCGPSVSASVEDSGLVAPHGKHDGCLSQDHPKQAHLHRSSRKQDAFPEMGNPFHGAPAMLQWQFKQALRNTDNQQDIPHQKRIEWLQHVARSTTPQRKVLVQSAIKRIKSQSKKPKNILMPNIEQLVHKACTTTPENGNLAQILLVQIRLQTMMRSVDASQIISGYFT